MERECGSVIGSMIGSVTEITDMGCDRCDLTGVGHKTSQGKNYNHGDKFKPHSAVNQRILSKKKTPFQVTPQDSNIKLHTFIAT